jgi:hypothetical protein
MLSVDMIGPSDMKVNRRRRAGASGVPVSIHGGRI